MALSIASRARISGLPPVRVSAKPCQDQQPAAQTNLCTPCHATFAPCHARTPPCHAVRTPVMLRAVVASRNYQGRTTTMNRPAFVYILAGQRNGTLYTGVIRDMVKRIFTHKTKLNGEGFTEKYNVDKLVWYQAGRDITAAGRGRWH